MITFASTNVEMPDLSRFDYREWIERVSASHNRTAGTINYMFCDDETILDYNRRFLGHDYYTDIITFDESRNNVINGDIIISIDTVKSNAAQLGVPESEELDRVIIHGVLHLCGINDKGPGEREQMEAAENAALLLRFPAQK